MNTADTRVTLLFNVDKSRSLTQLQKVAIKGKLRRRIDKRGVFRVTSQRFRSQKSNKDSAIERFIELMQWALKPVTPRRETAFPEVPSVNGWTARNGPVTVSVSEKRLM